MLQAGMGVDGEHRGSLPLPDPDTAEADARTLREAQIYRALGTHIDRSTQMQHTQSHTQTHIQVCVHTALLTSFFLLLMGV